MSVEPAAVGPYPSLPAVLLVGEQVTAMLPHVLAGTAHEVHPAADANHARLVLEWLPADVVVIDLRERQPDLLGLATDIDDLRPGASVLAAVTAADADGLARELGPGYGLVLDPGDILPVALDATLRARSAPLRLLSRFAGCDALPRRPEVHIEIVSLTSDPRTSLEDIAAAVERDLAAVADVMRLVNSAWFGLRTRVDSVVQAVRLLGVDVVAALAVASSVFGADRMPDGLDLAEVAERAARTAAAARRIAQLERWRADARSDIFVAALLADVGLLALAAAQPTEVAALLAARPVPGAADRPGRDELEAAAFGCSVAEASAAVLRYWGFDPVITRMLSELRVADPDRPWRPPGVAALLAARWSQSGDRGEPRPVDPWLTEDRWQRWLPGQVPVPRSSPEPTQEPTEEQKQLRADRRAPVGHGQ